MELEPLGPLVALAACWWGAAPLARRLPPAVSVPLLSVGAVVTALAVGLELGGVAVLGLAQLPPVAAAGHWSARALGAGDADPTPVGVLAALTVLVLLLSAAVRAVRAARALLSASVLCRRLGPDAGGLVIVDDPAPEAYALPGVRGRIVVSTAMLRALSPQERRALLAHEAAHLTHRHHVWLHLAELSAAANPLLRPCAAAVRLGVERWADELAAREVGDRRLVARTLARAGLARAAAGASATGVPALPVAALAAVAGDIGLRTRALLEDPPRRRPALAVAAVAMLLLGAVSSLETAHDTEARFEGAEVSAAAVAGHG